ncbi:DoxX family protein [Mucilaginibacter antarcticus]|uniref:MauE/DoxX family redox-associated membrane protein n=1 Tax=Mucilaginibacter antarcticus TaxID=1855725 RepID=A0ABW5XPL7_9SPHI
MKLIKTISLIILIIGYIGAGANHFIHPDGYVHIIPHYIPYPVFFNYLSGAFEILLGFLLIFNATRSIAAWGICLLLLAFLPVHIQMVIDAPFKLGTLMVTPLAAWARLALQPVLIWWAWWYTQPKRRLNSL